MAVIPIAEIMARSEKRVMYQVAGNSYSAIKDMLELALYDVGWIESEGGLLSKQAPFYTITTVPDLYNGRVKVVLNIGDGLEIVPSDNGGHTSPSSLKLYQATTYTILANPYQFIIVPSGSHSYRAYILVSTIHVPDFLQRDFLTTAIVGSEAHWLVTGFVASNPLNSHYMIHAAPDQDFAWFSKGSYGGARIYGIGTSNIFRVNEINAEVSSIKSPCLIAWSPGSSTGYPKIQGFLWDIMLIFKNYPINTVQAIDGKSYFIVGNFFGNSLVFELD